MQKKKNNTGFWKSAWLDVMIITILTVIISANINFMKFTPSLIYQGESSGDAFTTDLFFRISNRTQAIYVEPDITLIDIDSIKGRVELAKLLSSVLGMNPKAIGFDVFFNNYLNSYEDSSFVELINSLQKDPRCIYANAYDTTSNSSLPDVSHSFFLSAEDSLIEGFVNFVYDEKYMNVREYLVEKNTKEGRQQSLTYRMLTSQNNGQTCIDSGLHYIDYRLTSFNELKIDSIDSSLVEGKWVLIGSLSRNKDNFNTPIGMMPGLKIHAYTLKSLLSKSHIRSANKVWDWIVLSIICFLSSVGLVYADYIVFKKKNKTWSFIFNEGAFSLLFIFLQVILLLLIAYLIFEYCNVFFSMQSSLNGALFVAALVKAIFAACMAYLCNKKKLKQLLETFMYYSTNKQL